MSNLWQFFLLILKIYLFGADLIYIYLKKNSGFVKIFKKFVVNLSSNYIIMCADELNEAMVRYESLGNGNIVYLIQSSREGLSFSQFQQLSQNMPFSLKEWSEILHISERTIQRYKKESLVFEPLQSERILEIALLKRKGIDVFGTEDNFYTWLKSANPALGGIKPRELLDNYFGISLIKDELYRIEHGVLA